MVVQGRYKGTEVDTLITNLGKIFPKCGKGLGAKLYREKDVLDFFLSQIRGKISLLT